MLIFSERQLRVKKNKKRLGARKNFVPFRDRKEPLLTILAIISLWMIFSGIFNGIINKRMLVHYRFPARVVEVKEREAVLNGIWSIAVGSLGFPLLIAVLTLNLLFGNQI